MDERIFRAVAGAVEELNETRDEGIPTDDLAALRLYGDSGFFDSMNLVNFLVVVEERIEDEFDVEVSLTSERAVSRRVSPFASVARLVDFIEEELAAVTADRS